MKPGDDDIESLVRTSIIAVAFVLGMTVGGTCSYVLADSPPPREIRLRKALSEELTVWTTPKGHRVHVAHCRKAKGGCDSRVDRYAQWLHEASERHGLDPWILTAMALHESGMNPSATGAVGEFGVLQLHPRSKWGAKTQRQCKRSPSECTRHVIEAAAELLARCAKRCGDAENALGAYNTGKCVTNKYAKRVMRRRQALIENKGG